MTLRPSASRALPRFQRPLPPELGPPRPCPTPPTGVIFFAVPAYFVYIAQCADGTLYTGSTNDLVAREAKHNAGRGAKYTAARRPVRFIYSEAFESRSTAQSREAQIKRWTRAQKEALITDPAGERARR